MNILSLVIVIIILIISSGICNGLNISLMNLDLSDIKRKANLGNHKAKSILPLRKNYHLTLTSILLTNVAAASATTLVLHTRLNGLLSGLIATFLIVIFGEITPQALFVNSSLDYTYRFSPLLKFLVFLTYPISKPISTILDRVFPEKGTLLQSREELGLLIDEHLNDKTSELDDDEVVIMSGALRLSEKKVADIMTDIRHTFYLNIDDKLDDPMIDRIKENGYSRIPILDKDLTKCHGLLIMKNLVDIDFGENELSVSDMQLHPSPLVGSKTALDTLFRKFIAGRTHLLPVEKNDKIIGIVTIEDLIEEIIGHEIEDESDRRDYRVVT